MSIRRFFVPPSDGPQSASPPWTPGSEIPLPKEEARHARTVLRLRDGAEVEIFNGEGLVAAGALVSGGEPGTRVRIDGVTPHRRPAPRITIAFPPPKGKRTAAAVETLTELGADGLMPLDSARAVSGGGNPQKWRARAIEACKQSGRAYLPDILEAATVEGLAAELDEWEAAFLASPAGSPLQDALRERMETETVLWIVGPEGGFAPHEADLLLQGGAVPVRLGPHILRIGTAAALAAGATRLLLGRSN